MIHVIAVITTKPGKRAEVLEHFKANVPNVLAEDGCHAYEATVDADGIGAFQTKFGDDTFVVVERWESPAHLDAHIKAPHMADYAAKVKDMLADRVIHVTQAA
jgi:quinol monooxygenase YgiN